MSVPIQFKRISLIIVILLSGFFVRIWRFHEVPPGLQHDEIFKAEEGISLIEDGNFQIFYESNQGHEGFYVWLLGIAYAFLGKNLLMIKVVPLFIGTITIALAYRVFSKIYNYQIGILGSSLFAFIFFFVFLNRTGLRANLLLPITLITIELTVNLFVKQRFSVKSTVLLGVVVGLSIYSYTASLALILAVIIFLIYVFIVKTSVLVAHWKSIVLFVLLVAILILPMVSKRLNNPEGFNRMSSVADPLQDAYAGNWNFLTGNFIKLIGMVTFVGDPIWRYNVAGRPFIIFPLGLFFYIGAFLGLLDSKYRSQHILFLILFFSGIIPSLVTDAAPSYLRSIVALPSVVALTAYAIFRLSNWIFRDHPPLATNLFSFIFVVIILLADTYALHVTWLADEEVYAVYRDDLEQLANSIAALDAETIAVTALDNELDPILYSYYQPRGLRQEIIFFDATFNMVLPLQDGFLLVSPFAPVQYDNVSWLEARNGTEIPQNPLILRQDNNPAFHVYQLYPVQRLNDVRQNESTAQFYVGNAENQLLSTDLEVWADAYEYPIRFENILEVAFIDMPRLEISNQNDGVNLDLYLHPLQSYTSFRAQIFAHLLGNDGNIVAQRDLMGVHPSQWNSQTIVVQLNYIPLSQPIPAGEYVVAIGLYDWLTGQRYSVVDLQGNMVSDYAYVGTIHVFEQ
jgi:hypothetical protein